jgi:glyoxylase-like metal-dependent hydrolase (beta-lactamase superfamily II)
MNELEAQLHYPLGDALPAGGACLEVAPGIKWLRMPLPFALDHINLWLLRDALDTGQGVVEGWTVVDCGVSNPTLMGLWESVFANHLEGLPIVRVVATHMHPDHLGLAYWLCERWQVDLWISSTDYLQAKLGSENHSSFGGEGAAAFFALHGMTDPALLAQVRGRINYYASLVPSVPKRFIRLMDGQTLTTGSTERRITWHCIAGYGHAPEHIALHCPALNVLISGDMVLPRISTNISVYEMEPESNPLQLFLDSLGKFSHCPANTLVLPSHGKPFVGLAKRIEQLHQHHQERLAELMAACQNDPMTGVQALKVIFKRELDFHQSTFAMGEAIAHLHYLWHAGKLVRRRQSTGTWAFSAPPA